MRSVEEKEYYRLKMRYNFAKKMMNKKYLILTEAFKNYKDMLDGFYNNDYLYNENKERCIISLWRNKTNDLKRYLIYIDKCTKYYEESKEKYLSLKEEIEKNPLHT
jgi:hypothetical protein